jgi:hypothetical protein
LRPWRTTRWASGGCAIALPSKESPRLELGLDGAIAESSTHGVTRDDRDERRVDSRDGDRRARGGPTSWLHEHPSLALRELRLALPSAPGRAVDPDPSRQQCATRCEPSHRLDSRTLHEHRRGLRPLRGLSDDQVRGDAPVRDPNPCSTRIGGGTHSCPLVSERGREGCKPAGGRLLLVRELRSAAADGSTSGNPQEGQRRQDYWCSVKGEANERRPEVW